MDAVTVVFNGKFSVGQVVEAPDEKQSVAQYAVAVAEANDVPGDEFFFIDENGDPVDQDEKVTVLAGRRVHLTPLTVVAETPVTSLLGTSPEDQQVVAELEELREPEAETEPAPKPRSRKS